MKLYADAITGAVIQKAEIRRVFGSNRTPEFLFGKQVPALLVRQKGICVDVYPQRRSLIDGQRHSIESYLENSIKVLEFSSAEQHLQEAKTALANGLNRAAIIISLLALDGFIWRVLWGKKDARVVGPDGKRHPISSVDFVYRYARKSDSDFPNPNQFKAMKERNRELFKELRDSDGYLLKHALSEGVVKPHEADTVRQLRIIRNFCAHFNPYEKTLAQYHEAVTSLGLDASVTFSKLDELAQLIIRQTEELLSAWKSRVSVS